MNGTLDAPIREQTQPAPRQATRLAIYLKDPAKLRGLLAKRGCTSYRTQAELLGVGVATICRVYNGEACPAHLVAAIRNEWPRVSYTSMFREGPEQ